jgi:FkbM family methyltransferase
VRRVIPKVIAKLPYYLRSLNSLRRIATARSITRCIVLRDRRLNLTDGSTLELSGMIDLLVVKETLCDDVYGLADLNALDGVVVDVGAGIGDFTIAAASRSPWLRVVSYEPNPIAFGLLERNVAARGHSNVTLAPVAVGTRDAYVLHQLASGPRATAADEGSDGTAILVDAVRLDRSLPPDPVRLLKIDCEGLELDVLQSGVGVMDRVERVVVEFHRHLLPNADTRVAQFLGTFGFQTRTRFDRYDERIGYVAATRPLTDRRLDRRYTQWGGSRRGQSAALNSGNGNVPSRRKM